MNLLEQAVKERTKANGADHKQDALSDVEVLQMFVQNYKEAAFGAHDGAESGPKIVYKRLPKRVGPA